MSILLGVFSGLFVFLLTISMIAYESNRKQRIKEMKAQLEANGLGRICFEWNEIELTHLEETYLSIERLVLDLDEDPGAAKDWFIKRI